MTTTNPAPDVFVALVGFTGTNLIPATTAVTAAFERNGYCSVTVKLTEQLARIVGLTPATPDSSDEGARIESNMARGTRLCEVTKDASAVARLGVAQIASARVSRTESRPIVYVINQLKRVKEVEYLRALYGDAFVLVAVASPRNKRMNALARKIASGARSAETERFQSKALNLITKDDHDDVVEWGQNVRETFPLADLFVEENPSPEDMTRLVDLLLGFPNISPKKDEFAVFQAEAASLRSSDLGRQVGAVITTDDGDVIAVGVNEVPKALGGQYWPTDSPKDRDLERGHDSVGEFRNIIARHLIDRLRELGWLSSETLAANPAELGEKLSRDFGRSGSLLGGLLEFGRPVHAEMAALMSAARRGVGVDRCTLYSTTFPCHICAKHIISAGIKRVVYVHPYSKSRVRQLHDDAVSLDGESTSGAGPKVAFEQYLGVAPRRYLQLFRARQRKRSDGSAIARTDWSPTFANVSATPSTSDEQESITQFQEALRRAGLSIETKPEA